MRSLANICRDFTGGSSYQARGLAVEKAMKMSPDPFPQTHPTPNAEARPG
ncbi:MAG: hypothetical protein U0132_23195 [Gemmatimonadaceae bacterium]